MCIHFQYAKFNSRIKCVSSVYGQVCFKCAHTYFMLPNLFFTEGRLMLLAVANSSRVLQDYDTICFLGKKSRRQTCSNGQFFYFLFHNDDARVQKQPRGYLYPGAHGGPMQ